MRFLSVLFGGFCAGFVIECAVYLRRTQHRHRSCRWNSRYLFALLFTLLPLRPSLSFSVFLYSFPPSCLNYKLLYMYVCISNVLNKFRFNICPNSALFFCVQNDSHTLLCACVCVFISDSILWYVYIEIALTIVAASQCLVSNLTRE